MYIILECLSFIKYTYDNNNMLFYAHLAQRISLIYCTNSKTIIFTIHLCAPTLFSVKKKKHSHCALQ